MKYSIRGVIRTSDDLGIMQLINNYLLYKLDLRKATNEEGVEQVVFEAWLPNQSDKVQLFDATKEQVDIFGGVTDWHECSHDEAEGRPCVIVESYEV